MSDSMNLYQKIAAVMKDIQYLQKDDKVSMGTSGSYKAMSEEKVTQVVRESLITHGLVILPVEQTHTRDELRDKDNVLKGYLSIVDTRYKIVDIDTGQSEMLASGGTGADTQDKGIGKAMTYSYKYLLLRTFAIPTGDDPDKTSSSSLDEQHEASKRQSQPPRTQQSSPQGQPHNPPPTTTAPPTGQSGAPVDPSKRVYAVMNALGWKFEDVQNFATDLFGRQIKHLKNQIKDDEWDTLYKGMKDHKETGWVPLQVREGA